MAAMTLRVSNVFPPIPRRAEYRFFGIAEDECVAYRTYSEVDGECTLFHLHGERAELHRTVFPPRDLMDSASGKRTPTLMKIDRQLALHVNARTIQLVNERLEHSDTIEISNDLPGHPEHANRTRQPYPDARAGLADSQFVPLLMPGDWCAPRAVRHIALLNVDLAARVATWSKLGGRDLFHLRHDDFPNTYLGDEPPVIHDVLYRDETLYVYTLGPGRNYVKWGMRYFGLVTLNHDLQVNDSILFEVPSETDPKRRGRVGDFTTSLEYCVITPGFPSSDTWKKKQRLLNLETRQLHEVRLPRGYARYRIVDHAHGTFWLTHDDHPTELSVIACRAT